MVIHILEWIQYSILSRLDDYIYIDMLDCLKHLILWNNKHVKCTICHFHSTAMWDNSLEIKHPLTSVSIQQLFTFYVVVIRL